MNKILQSLKQSEQAYNNWINGGKEEAYIKVRLLLLEEIIKRYKDMNDINFNNPILCSDGKTIDFDLSNSLKLYIQLIKQISKEL